MLVLMGFGIPFCVRKGLFLGWGFVVVLMCVFVVVVWWLFRQKRWMSWNSFL